MPRPKPRTQPPAWRSTPPSVVLKPQRSVEDFYPPLFLGFLALVFFGSIGYLLLGPDREQTELTPEEIHALAGRTPYRSTLSKTPTVSGSAAGGVEAEAGSAALYIETTPSGASVTIDGEVVGETPVQLNDRPAKWQLVAVEKEGFRAADTLVYLSESFETNVSLQLASSSARRDESPDAPRSERTSEEPSRARDETAREAPRPSAPTTGTLRVRVTPEGVPVQLDGQTVGVAPLELEGVAPGSHTLKFFLPDYETATVQVEVAPGEQESVEVTMARRMGNLAVVVRPWGSIYVDGTLVAENTDVRFDTVLPVGRHHIRVVHPALGSEERTLDVEAEGTATVTFNLK